MGSLALNEVCWLDGCVAVIVRGVVDDDTVERFERTLDLALGAGSRELVIDLTACQLTSAGFAALIRFQRRTSSSPVATRLVASGVDLVRMLQIVGLTSKFRTYATLDAALHGGINGVATRPARQARPRVGAEVRHLATVESSYGSRQ